MYSIVITKNANLAFDRFQTSELESKTVGEMWNTLKEFAKDLTPAEIKNGVMAVITNMKTNEYFKDVTFRMNSTGRVYLHVTKTN